MDPLREQFRAALRRIKNARTLEEAKQLADIEAQSLVETSALVKCPVCKAQGSIPTGHGNWKLCEVCDGNGYLIGRN
jgi:DnaJ-class molecular chaperone